MVMKYNIYFEVASVLVLFILLLFLRLQYNMQSKVNKEFLKLTVLALIANILDVVTAVTISYAEYVPVWLNVLLNTLFFLTMALACYQLMFYSEYYVYHNAKKSWFLRANQIMLIIYAVVLSVVNPLTGCIFYFNEEAEYVHGVLYYAIDIIPYYLVVCSVIFLTRDFRNFQPWKRASIIIYVLLGTSGSVVQLFFAPDILLSMFTMALGFLMMMFTLETPDYQNLIRTIEELQRTKEIAEQAKEEADRAREIAQEANRAKTDFLANMSHEIRTPINGILGMDAILLKECKDKEMREYAVNIQSAGQSLLSIINDILDISKVESGKLQLYPARYELFSVLNDCYHMAVARINGKPVSIVMKIDPMLPSVLKGDEVRVRQIINNLLSNAVKYTKKGTVTLELGYRKAEGNKIELIISVTDTGIGIKKEDQKKLFEAFSRVEEKRNRNIEGTGLGLNLTKKLVEMMDGEISVESTYGEGSCFTARFEQSVMVEDPIGDFSERYRQFLIDTGVNEGTLYAPDARILVVDDVEMNLKVVKGLLKETGMQIDTAISGRECLECIKENQYDIIFLDHMMPEMDGVETLQRIKELPDNPNADKPVVMLTANAIIGAREEYLKEGFTDYLSKPIREKELDRTIKKYLPPERLTVREKEEPEEVSESMTEKKEESKTLMQRLEELPELDTGTGIHYCADNKEFYQEIVQEYANTDKTRDMKELYQSKDWDEYRIMVHALKSSSLTIGAVGLSEAAKALEMAAKEKDLEYIEQHHEEVLGRYTALLEVLQDIYQKA